MRVRNLLNGCIEEPVFDEETQTWSFPIKPEPLLIEVEDDYEGYVNQ